MESGAETPWAKLQRLRAEGIGYKAIARELKTDGMSDDDVATLFSDIPEARDLVERPVSLKKPRSPLGPNSSSLMRWVGMCVGVFGLFASAVAAAAHYVLGFPAAVVFGGALLALLFFEIRASPRRTARRFATLGLVAAIIPVIYGLGNGFNTVLATIGAFGAASIPLYLWGAARKQVRGIGEELKLKQVFELDGVQFVFGLPPKEEKVPPGGSVTLRFVVQNVLDAPRRVSVICHTRPRMISRPDRHEFDVEPGVIEERTLPFRLLETAAAKVSLLFDVQVQGALEGRRLRDSEGLRYEPKDPEDVLMSNVLGVATFVTLGRGTLHFGTTGFVEVQVDPSLPEGGEAPEPSVKVLHRPSELELKRAARG